MPPERDEPKRQLQALLDVCIRHISELAARDGSESVTGFWGELDALVADYGEVVFGGDPDALAALHARVATLESALARRRSGSLPDEDDSADLP